MKAPVSDPGVIDNVAHSFLIPSISAGVLYTRGIEPFNFLSINYVCGC